MNSNNLSFSITVRNNASTALNALRSQVSSIKNGLDSLGSSSTSTSRFLNSLNGGIGRTTKSFGGFGSTVKRAIGVFAGFKVASGIMNVLTGSMDQALSRIDSMDLFSQKMQLITGDAAGTAQSLEHLKKSTKGTPYALDAAARGVQNFVLRGQSLQQATDSIDIWMDAVSTYGKGTTEQLESVIDAIGKMRTKGTVEMRYLNRLFAAGINPVQMYAQATGQAATDVQNALSHKEISTEDFLNVVETAMREGTNGVTKITGNAKTFAKTWSATLANMRIAIARGRAELVEGIESIFDLSHEGALKETVLGFGTGIETVFSGIGKGLQRTAGMIKTVYDQLKKNNQALFNGADQQISNSKQRASVYRQDAATNVKTGFFDALSPKLVEAIAKFKQLQVTWAGVSNTIAAGLLNISKPLGTFLGNYLGRTITGLEDIGIAFGEWLKLKLPPFFDTLKQLLQWFIDHQDAVVSTVRTVIKAMLGFSVLQGLQSILIGFNDKLKMINDTLAFFTFGKLQLPTIESIVNSRTETKNQKALEQLERENKLKKERNALETTYNNQVNRIRTQTAKDLTGLNKNQIRDEVKISNAHKKEYSKLNTNKDRAEARLKQNKADQLSRLDTVYQTGVNKADSTYSKDIARINKQKEQDTVKIMKAQHASVVKSNKKNGIDTTPTDLNKLLGMNLAGDYATSKVLNQDDINKRSKLYDDIYNKIQKENIDYTKSPFLSDIYNSRKGYEDRLETALNKKKSTRKSLNNDYFSGRGNVIRTTNDKLDQLQKEYNAQIELLNKNTKSGISNTRSKYTAKKNKVKKAKVSGIVDAESAYNIGLDALEPKKTKKKGILDRFGLNPKESFKNTGNELKNIGKKIGEAVSKPINYVKNSAIATGRGVKETAVESGLLLGRGLTGAKDKVKTSTSKAINDTAKGFEKFGKVKLNNIASDFKEVGKSTATVTKNATTSTVKGTTGGIGNFFSTMFGGFGNLKKQDKTPKSDIRGTIKKGWDWLNTDAQGNKTFTAQKAKNFFTTPAKAVKNTAKSTGSGIGNFFGTMFSGFKGLGKGSSVQLGVEGAEEATTKVGLLQKVLDGLKAALKFVTEGLKSVGTWLLNFVTTAAGAVVAIVAVTAAIGAFAAGLGVFNPGNKVSDAINNFFTSFSEWCTTFAQNAPILIQSFVNGLIEDLPTLVTQGVNLLLSIVNGIMIGIPKLLTVGVSVILSLVSGLAQVLPELVYQGFNAIGQFVAGIIQNLPNILSAAWELIKTLAIGLLKNAPVIIASGIKLIINLITGIGSMLSQVGTAIKDLIVNSVTYVWEHPQEIWDSITGLCGELWNALISGLYAAADVFDAGWILDKMGLQRPEVAEGGADTAQAAIDGANEKIANTALDIKKIWDNTDVDSAKDQAAVDGQEVASQMTDAANNELAEGAVDAGQAGVDTANSYVDGVNTGIAENAGTVDTAISSVGQEGLANLSVSFNSEQVMAAAANLISNLNNAINTNAPTLYMTMAVVAQNCITQLAAGFAVGDEVPSGIAEAMTGVVMRVGENVRVMCDNIRSQLTDAKNISEQTSQELATEIEKNFETAKVGVGGSLQQMKNSLVTQYDEMRAAIYTDLSSIAGFHEIYSAEQIEFYETTVTTGLQRIKDRYSELDRDVRNRLNALKDFHKQVATDAMQGMIDGLESKRPAVASKEAEIVLLLKTTFEDGLGIHSPSRWGEWVGQMIVLGMVQGLSEGGKLGSFVSAIIDDMRNSFKNGKFNADELVDYMGQDGTMKVVKYLEYIGDQTVADAINGDGGTPAIITEALKYVGYAPGGGNSMFGLHYGNPGAWCASFVRYCAEKVGVPFPATNYVPDVLAWSIANGRYTQTPQPGYAAIFGGGSHIELVAGVSPDGTVDYVGGNTGMGEVKHRPRSDATSFVALDGGHSTFTLKDTIMRAYNKKFNPAALLGGATGAAYNPSAGVAQWRDIVLQALAMLGQPSSLVDDVLYAIECESSGNPNAINLTDSNAAAGHPSQGLLQTIPETFAAYRNPNLPDNITDPLANVYAALNYMIQRYGSIENVINPRRGGWSGYAVGTRYVPQDMMTMIHKDEAILPASQNPYSQSGGNYLYDLFSNVMSNDNGELSGLGFDVNSLQGNTNNTNNSNINFSNNFEIHNSNNVDADRNISNMEAMFIQMIRDGRAQGVPR